MIIIRNLIGRKLAPHDAWGDWAVDIEGRSEKKRGGMRSLVMEQQDLVDRRKGYIRTKIEPSSKIKNNVGIYIEVNDHYEVENLELNQGCEELIGLLSRNFDVSINKSEWIIDQIMKLKEELK